MPVYEYQCQACGREFEYQQRMADPEKTVCEACGAEKLERLISRTAFQLKGGGWYKDLYSSTKPETKSGEGGGDKVAVPAAKTDGGAAPSSAPAAPAASTPSSPSSPSTSSTGSSSASSSSGSSGGSSSGGGSTTKTAAASKS